MTPQRQVVVPRRVPLHRPARSDQRTPDSARVAPRRPTRSLALKHIDGRSLSEIVALLGKPEADVAGLLRWGVAALKQKLREAFELRISSQHLYLKSQEC
ncbi:MAG: hypothetical protein HZA46_07885 [Planctomycetales bacterium]|nr:hypothetical protein [Planctomycetales bacterium]